MEAGQKRDRPIRVARRVYVGNLAWKTGWQELKDYFGQVGTVVYADVLREAGPGSRSKGCGIVEFETPEQAAAAIQTLNHTDLDERQIFVREDREDSELKPHLQADGDNHSIRSTDRMKRTRPFGALPPNAAGPVTIGRRVWVGNLGFETTWQDLKDHFRQAGAVTHADIMQDPEGNSKGCGLVTFASPQDALRAISLLSNSQLGDRQIMVREDREDPSLQRRGPMGGMGGMPMGGPAFGGLPGAGGQGTQLVFHGLPFSLAWQELKDLARQAGNVVHADVMMNPDGSSKGWGVVQYASPQDAMNAIQRLNGVQYEGRVITVKYDKFAQ